MQTFSLVFMKCSSFIPTINTLIEVFKFCEKVPFTDLLSPLFITQGTVGPGGSVSTMSDNIWSTLRMTLSLMGRSELHRAVDTRDLDQLNAVFQTESHDDGAVIVWRENACRMFGQEKKHMAFANNCVKGKKSAHGILHENETNLS